MSQSILIHVHGERIAQIEPHLTLTGMPLRTPAEAAEARARQRTILGTTGHGMAHNVRTGKDGDGDGGRNLSVQVQIEQAVVVDYDPKTDRKTRVFWERKQGDVTNGVTSSADHSQWELSNVTKLAAGTA
jgi:hypothetical protein